ncbi:hypothetical protein [Kitasatospora sp. NPDC051914]|uniref:hypothetical protein n=1 Tax=Kitasatospora sp. NPDC051914 TaxID=3154945 RepID=UPI003444FF9D
MRLRTVRTAIAAGALGMAALTGCGINGTKSTDDPTIAGAVTGSASQSASASPSAAGVPEAVLPDGVSLTVEAQPTGDSQKDAVLAGVTARYRAVYQAIGRQDPEDALYKQWTTATVKTLSARQHDRTYIANLVGKKHTVTGVYRVYDPKFVTLDDAKANVTWCEDQTKAFAKEVATGKVLTTTPSRTDYIFFEANLEKAADGRWLTSALLGHGGDSRCQ